MDYSLSSALKKWISTVIIISTIVIKSANTQLPILNTPPVISVDRDWRISETEKIGSIIVRVRAQDEENDHLTFDLEPLFHGDYFNPSNPSSNTNGNLPFQIDHNTGIVRLNESLVGRGGDNFFLYVTVSDGQLTAKNEISVNIYHENDDKIYDSRPSIPPRNISQLFPYFSELPGVKSIRNHANNPRQPSGTTQQGHSLPQNLYPDLLNTPSPYPKQDINSNIYIPHNQNQQPLRNGDINSSDIDGISSNRPTNSIPSSTNNIKTNGFNEKGKNNSTNINSNSNDFNDNSNSIRNSSTSSSSSSSINSNNNNSSNQSTRTKLTPIKTNTNKPVGFGTNDSSLKNKSHNQKDDDESITNNGNDPSSYKNRDDFLNNINGGNGSHQVTSSHDQSATVSVKTVIPVIITICGIFLAAGIIALVIFRKHLCAIGKSLKKKSKEEMAKKSNQSNLSSNITDDSRNSMVLQHWSGPLAFSNRYVPWERDNQQLSMVTSQLSTSSSNGASTGCIGNGVGNGSNSQSSKTDRWEFPRHRLKFFNILGEGAFGQVWRCEATNIDGNDGVTTVAVKTLKESATEIERNDLYSELQVMKSLEPHVNVVRLLGSCTDKDPIFVIIEYVNRGKLQTYLRNSRAERHYGNTHGKSNILTSGDLTSFMYQVAKGMDYLTSRGIIHRDLAARNILITDDHTCKIADFGFARDVITSKIYERKSEGKLPIRWMAIESLYDNIFSVKSDIWSFGILMWEIVTLGSTPYPGISAADVMRKVRDGYRLEKPEHCRRELYNIMYYCWAKDPNERPSFSELVLMLDKLLHTEMDYIELERFPDHNYYNILNLSGEKL